MRPSTATVILMFCITCCVKASDFGPEIVVSERDQKLALINGGKVEAQYRISTSKFGLGDSFGSYKTPLGKLFISNKLGHGLQPGAVIKNRNPTGEILKVDAPGRDPIVTRVIWLQGLEAHNQNTHGRCIYIHGTPEERNIGKRTSYGCIRMRSKDVIELFEKVRVGTQVMISTEKLSKLLPQKTGSSFALLRTSKSQQQTEKL